MIDKPDYPSNERAGVLVFKPWRYKVRGAIKKSLCAQNNIGWYAQRSLK